MIYILFLDRPDHFEQFPDAVKLMNTLIFEQANVIATIALIFIVLPKGTDPYHAFELIEHVEKNLRVLLPLKIRQARIFINVDVLNMRSISNDKVPTDRFLNIKICYCNFP